LQHIGFLFLLPSALGYSQVVICFGFDSWPFNWNYLELDWHINLSYSLMHFFVVVLVAFCGASYLEVVKSRDDEVPTKGDFLAALLPLVCIPAVLSLCSGLHKWWVTHGFNLVP